MTATTPHESPRPLPWVREGWPTLALPALLAVVQLVGTYFASRGQPERDPLDAFAVLLLIAGPAALAAWPRWPLITLWGATGAALLYMLMGYPYGPVIFSPVIALYLTVTRGRRVAAWSAAGALYGGHFGARLLMDIEPPSWGEALGVGAWLLVILVVSEVLRVRRERVAEAERTHAEESRRRASEERLFIARELHDVLAHHISLMNVQAGVGLHLFDQQPEQARTALTAIEQASREAMGELRSVLNILHRPDEAAPRAPTPSLARLEGIVTQASAAGLDVRTEVAGEARVLPAPVEAAAYRVVQEAVTNVIRHAAATSALVRLSYGEHELTVQVEDDGVGGASHSGGTGKGLEGMRERVYALGGQFEAGPLPGRGFRVRASLPAEGAP
ncbi:MAG: sensor histidine kinase [Dehalococcoidia bacterium]|nr:sensor histidine kinase [Dehalococcoidia bacterium]